LGVWVMNERVPWQGWRRKGEDAGLPAARGQGSRRPFGATWWGRAWLEALEHRARLDPNRLARGRSYARRGSVLELTVSPGAVEAVVQGSRVTPYQVTVRIRAFSTSEWDAVLDVVSSQIGRVAALLDGELPPEVVDDVHAAGLELLPSAGEVLTNCSCPDFAVPCKHSAAVCYLVADALDDDPFALLLLRGKRRDELLSALRSRRSGPDRESTPALRPPPSPGVLAKAAFTRVSAPVPVPPRPLGSPGLPAAVRVLDPPRSSGVDVRDLVALAADAARRAWEFASGDGDGGLGLTFEQDLARRAALVLGTPELADLAHRAGVPARQLTSWAVAWREGGPGGLAVAVEPLEVDEAALAEGVEVLGGSVDGNRVTAGRTQLRLGRDALWYRFDQHFNDWTLTRPPSPDPRDLLTP
jgi:uncharacterized Zn finger protein